MNDSEKVSEYDHEIKHFSCIFTFWKQLKLQIIKLTVSKATLNCMQNT